MKIIFTFAVLICVYGNTIIAAPADSTVTVRTDAEIYTKNVAGRMISLSAMVPKGEEVQFIEADGSAYVKIEYNGNERYLWEWVFDIEDIGEVYYSLDSYRYAVERESMWISASQANLRESNLTNSTVVGQLN